MDQDAIIGNQVTKRFGRAKQARRWQKLFSTRIPQTVVGATQHWLALLVGLQPG